MEIVYFEDLEPGQVMWGDEVLVDRAEMMAYNQQNDPWPIHVNESAASTSPFGGLIASGGFTITLMYRSLLGIYNNDRVRWEFLGGLDWQLKFAAPVRPGDVLRSRMTIENVRPSSKGNRGVLNSTTDMVNQDGEIVMSVAVVSFLASRTQT